MKMPAPSRPTRRSTSRAPARYSSQIASVPSTAASTRVRIQICVGSAANAFETPARPPYQAPSSEVREVRVGGRVDVVVRVPAVAEQADRARDEVRVLVGVVGVRQPVVDAPDPQAEREHEQRRRRPAPHHSRSGVIARSPSDRRHQDVARSRGRCCSGPVPRAGGLSTADIGGVVLARRRAVEAGAAAGCRRGRRWRSRAPA